MRSAVSSEKPQALLVRQIAERMREVKAAGKKILWVGGPAVVHTGAAPAMVRLVRAGYVDVLFAGNALATHDIESSLFGTSLGVDLAKGSGVPHGHEHHIRAINTIRRGRLDRRGRRVGRPHRRRHARDGAGGQAVRAGRLGARRRPAARRLHRRHRGPARDARRSCPTSASRSWWRRCCTRSRPGTSCRRRSRWCSVDINPATVTKLADRGSAQAMGIITDIGLFLEQLARELAPE